MGDRGRECRAGTARTGAQTDTYATEFAALAFPAAGHSFVSGARPWRDKASDAGISIVRAGYPCHRKAGGEKTLGVAGDSAGDSYNSGYPRKLEMADSIASGI